MDATIMKPLLYWWWSWKHINWYTSYAIAVNMFQCKLSFLLLVISPVSEGSGDVMVLRRSRPPPAARCPPPAARNGVNGITQKPRDGLFSNLVYTLVVIVSWPDQLFKVVGQRSRSQRQKMMWFFSTFLNFNFLSHFPPKPSWGGHSNTPQQ